MIAPQYVTHNASRLPREVEDKIEQLRLQLTTLLDDEDSSEPKTSADL